MKIKSDNVGKQISFDVENFHHSMCNFNVQYFTLMTIVRLFSVALQEIVE